MQNQNPKITLQHPPTKNRKFSFFFFPFQPLQKHLTNIHLQNLPKPLCLSFHHQYSIFPSISFKSLPSFSFCKSPIKMWILHMDIGWTADCTTAIWSRYFSCGTSEARKTTSSRIFASRDSSDTRTSIMNALHFPMTEVTQIYREGINSI